MRQNPGYSTIGALAVTSGGNVGIGTTAPTYALDVSGTTQLSGYVHTVGALFAQGNGTDDLRLYNVRGSFYMYGTTTAPNGPIIDYDINASATLRDFIRLGNGTMAGGTTAIAQNIVTSTPTFTTTAGSTIFNNLNIAPTINQTSSANGIAR